MIDLFLDLTEDGPDLKLEAGDLVADLGLSSAVLVSLFSDRRATPDDLVPPDDDPRGWPLETPGDRWGSRLWLLERAKATQENVALARAAVQEALAWLVEDGIAESIEVRVELARPDKLFLEVDVVRGTARRWPKAWEAVELGLTVREVSGTTFRLLFR